MKTLRRLSLAIVMVVPTVILTSGCGGQAAGGDSQPGGSGPSASAGGDSSQPSVQAGLDAARPYKALAQYFQAKSADRETMLAAKDSQLAAQGENLIAAQGQAAQYRDQRDQAHRALTQAQAHSQDLEGQVLGLGRQLDDANTTLAGMSAQRDALQGSLDEVQRRLDGLNQTNAADAGTIAALQQQRASLQDEVSSLNQQIDTLNATIASNTQELASDQAQLATAQQSVAQLTTEKDTAVQLARTSDASARNLMAASIGAITSNGQTTQDLFHFTSDPTDQGADTLIASQADDQSAHDALGGAVGKALVTAVGVEDGLQRLQQSDSPASASTTDPAAVSPGS